MRVKPWTRFQFNLFSSLRSRLDTLLEAVAEHIESGRSVQPVTMSTLTYKPLSHRIEHTPTGLRSDLTENVVRSRLAIVVAVLHKIKCVLAEDANECTPIYRLPDDILVEIWDWLSVNDRIELTTISKRWRRDIFPHTSILGESWVYYPVRGVPHFILC